jgi:hypothetical protein
VKCTTWLKWATAILVTMLFMGGWATTGIVGAQASTWHVATDGSDITGDGSEAKPFATIQQGIVMASDGDTVLVHPGIYRETIDFVGKNIVVGSLLVTTGDEGYIHQTVIDGHQDGHVVTFENGEAATATLSGFTIANGYAHGASSPGYHGGGIFCLDSNPTLTHLKVSGNETTNEGGGLFFDHCSSTVQDVVVTNNLAGRGGGGIRYSYGSASLENVIVAHNSARGDGAISFTRITVGAIVNEGDHSSGACWGDYDNDGWLDLFVANWAGENNFLYHNNSDGTFEKITSGAVVNDGGWSRGCTWGDYDNDGFLDLFVSNDGGGNFLYHNDGGASFSRVLTGPIAQDWGNCYGTAWVDYDNDGWLDLFVARHTNDDNLLYHNLGDGTFERITAGDVANNGGYSVPASWGDYDGDGCADLFVGNVNYQDNFLYHNNCDGTFTRITDSPITMDDGFSGSGNWVDYDNDQDLDLFVANVDDENFLFRNNGDGTFTEILTSVIVAEGDVHDSSWADLDNDGDMDLYMGAVHTSHRLYQNDGGGTFTPVTGVPVVEDSSSEIGIWGDYDNDGDLDLFVTSPGLGRNFLYRNESTENHWINVKLIGTASSRTAIGARVTVSATINGVSVDQIREVSGSTGGFGQDSLNVEFGLGDAAIIDSIVVEWPSGIVQVLGHVTVDRFMTIREPDHWMFLPVVMRNQEP